MSSVLRNALTSDIVPHHLRSRFASMSSMATMDGFSNAPGGAAGGAVGGGVIVPIHIPLHVITIDDLETFYLTSRIIVVFVTSAFKNGNSAAVVYLIPSHWLWSCMLIPAMFLLRCARPSVRPSVGQSVSPSFRP